MGFVNVGLILISVTDWLPGLFPNGDLLLACILYTVLYSFVALIFTFFTAAMPRSGGDYVFVGRTVWPPLGIISNTSFIVGTAASTGVLTWLMAGLFQTPFTAWGVFFGNAQALSIANWITSHDGGLVFGTFLMLLSFIILALGLKWLMRFLWVSFVIGMIGALLVLGILATSSNQSFIAAYNAFAGPDAYQTLIQKGIQAGWSHTGFSWEATFAAIAVLLYIVVGWSNSAWFGSELKNPKKNAFIGIMGTFFACNILTIAVLELSINTVGYDFLGTSGWFYFVLPAQLPMPFAPTPPNFALILYPNPIVAAVIGISMVAWSIMLFPAIYMAFSRSFLAWSLDRILPKQMATVWQQTHSPIVASGTACLLGEIFLVAYYLVPADFSLNLILVSLVLFLSLGLAAVLFPFRLKDTFNRSPVNYRVGGIPLMSIIGIISILGILFTGYYVITDPDIAGPVQLQTIGIVAAIVAFALILFYSRRAYLKSKGLDLDLVFKEIPIE